MSRDSWFGVSGGTAALHSSLTTAARSHDEPDHIVTGDCIAAGQPRPFQRSGMLVQAQMTASITRFWPLMSRGAASSAGGRTHVGSSQLDRGERLEVASRLLVRRRRTA